MIVTRNLDRISGPMERSHHSPHPGGAARALQLLCALLMLLFGAAAAAAGSAPANSLQSVDFSALPGNQVQITLTMAKPAKKPLSFTIDNPARIALDFLDTTDNLAKRSQVIGIGMAKSLTAVQAEGRTRVVLDLVEMVPYETRVDGNKVILTLQDKGALMAMAASEKASGTTKPAPGTTMHSITDVQFHRGEHGEGRVIVSLSDPSIPVDMHQQGNDIVLDFYNATLPKKLERRLNVVDFGTPVTTIDTYTRGNNVHMVIKPTGTYEHLAYQADDKFTVEVKPVTKAAQEAAKKAKFGYSGQRLSLNFQDIEVRSVLQLIADFTGKNIVVSDSVKGNLTLRLKNVPWDQALDIILQTKGLAKREDGNVILVAPQEELAAREKLELESQKQIQELVPVTTDFIQVNYAKADDMEKLIKGSGGASMLTKGRGHVSVDERTNTLIVTDTPDKIDAIRKVVARLDIPVRQVLIESRIVIANNDFARDLGVKFGLSKNTAFDGNNFVTVGGTQPGGTSFQQYVINPGSATPTKQPVITGFEAPAGSGNEGLLVNLPATNATAALGLAVGRLGNNLLQLELSAMQAEGKGEVVSSPRVITSNQKEALIEQGVEIPYQQASSSGATNVQFKKATLSLKVTPLITPDDRIILDLNVTKDSVGQVFQGVPSINTRQVTTQVLMDNGETVVLGGIYEQTRSDQMNRVPFFGDLPGIGWLFREHSNVNNKSELLIFVTPKIVKQSLSIQ